MMAAVPMPMTVPFAVMLAVDGGIIGETGCQEVGCCLVSLALQSKRFRQLRRQPLSYQIFLNLNH